MWGSCWHWVRSHPLTISPKFVALIRDRSDDWHDKVKLVHRTKSCLINLTRIVSTIILLLLIAGNSLSLIKLDVNTILLMLMIVLLWFTPTLARYFETIEITRENDKLSLSLSFARLQAIEQSAQDANLLQTPENLGDIEKFVEISKINPNAALITLRTDIEHKLFLLVQGANLPPADGLPNKPLSIREALRVLEQANLLTKQEIVVLQELISTLNRVVHSADVTPQVIQWAIDTGPFLLTALDKKLSDLQNRTSGKSKAE